MRSQQAVEKFVKAVLTARGIDAPRTHDATGLRGCSDVRYAGPVGFLMAKADALFERKRDQGRLRRRLGSA
jgi:HEPN domain-containing protein